MLAVDLNHGHLAAWVITPDGNPTGPPVTIPLDLDHLPASQRDGRLRAAVTALISIAQTRGCAAIAVEDLDFAAPRELGRERTARRPSRGRRGRAWRRLIAGLPTAYHAAAVVIGRRAHGHRARRRAGKTGRGQRTAGRRATRRAPSHGSDQGTAGPEGLAAATTVAQDRHGHRDQPARPGGPPPFGATH